MSTGLIIFLAFLAFVVIGLLVVVVWPWYSKNYTHEGRLGELIRSGKTTYHGDDWIHQGHQKEYNYYHKDKVFAGDYEPADPSVASF